MADQAPERQAIKRSGRGRAATLRCAALWLAVLAPIAQTLDAQTAADGGSAASRTQTEPAVTLTVLSSHALEGVLRELSPLIERATGARLQLKFDTSGALRTAIAQGSGFDVGILAADAIPALTTSGRLLSGGSVDIARTGIGMVVRAGAPHPDISSIEAFKRSLLAAHSVAFTATGESGLYFERLLRRLGLAAAVNAKARRPRGGLIAELIAQGDAELGVQQIGELKGVPGVDYIGPLPESLQHYTLFAACLSSALVSAPAASQKAIAGAARARAARALIVYLTGPQARAAISARGMLPISMPFASAAGASP